MSSLDLFGQTVRNESFEAQLELGLSTVSFQPLRVSAPPEIAGSNPGLGGGFSLVQSMSWGGGLGIGVGFEALVYSSTWHHYAMLQQEDRSWARDDARVIWRQLNGVAFGLPVSLLKRVRLGERSRIVTGIGVTGFILPIAFFQPSWQYESGVQINDSTSVAVMHATLVPNQNPFALTLCSSIGWERITKTQDSWIVELIFQGSNYSLVRGEINDFTPEGWGVYPINSGFSYLGIRCKYGLNWNKKSLTSINP